MLRSAEYIDPVLAQKIVNLEAELHKIQSSKNEILNNRSLQVSTKNKLLKYQIECEQNIKKLLSEERDKLAEYLDQQTNVITKENRKSVSHQYKNSFALNQSTRIDLSTDDSKSFEYTRKSETFTKSMNTIHFNHTDQSKSNYNHLGNKNRVKLRRLSKKVSTQQKLINMLVLWVKIYHEREQQYASTKNELQQAQDTKLSEQNKLLRQKCDRLHQQLQCIRSQFRLSSQRALQTHRQREQLRAENKEYQLKRSELINTIRSLEKHGNKK